MLRTVFDPEIPVNVYDLGLLSKIDYTASEQTLHVAMTLTAPGRPAALGPMVNSRMGAQPFSDEFPLDAGGEGVYPTLLAAVQRRQAGIPVPIIP